jgi:hypothetical protein
VLCQAGGPSSPASDMYAVGVVLYSMHFPDQPPPIAGAVSVPLDADADLRDLVKKLLDTDPLRRPTASNALLHPYFRQSHIDRMVNLGEIMEQAKKLGAIRTLLHRARYETEREEAVQLEVSRADQGRSLVLKVLDYLDHADPAQLSRPLRVTFTGEAGVDQGGLLTEMYTLFFDAVVNPDVGLFETAAAQGTSAGPRAGPSGAKLPGLTTGPAPPSRLHLPKAAPDPGEQALRRFWGFGRLLVKCLFDGRRIGAHFAPALFKFLCDVEVGLQVSFPLPQTLPFLIWR